MPSRKPTLSLPCGHAEPALGLPPLARFTSPWGLWPALGTSLGVFPHRRAVDMEESETILRRSSTA